MNSERYLKIIDDLVVPSLDVISENIDKPIFQNYSASCHRAKILSSHLSAFTKNYLLFR